MPVPTESAIDVQRFVIHWPAFSDDCDWRPDGGGATGALSSAYSHLALAFCLESRRPLVRLGGCTADARACPLRTCPQIVCARANVPILSNAGGRYCAAARRALRVQRDWLLSPRAIAIRGAGFSSSRDESAACLQVDAPQTPLRLSVGERVDMRITHAAGPS